MSNNDTNQSNNLNSFNLSRNSIHSTNRHNTNNSQYNQSYHSVRYEDLTTIDWNREFAKERSRKLNVEAGGKWYWLYDSSQVWIVLLLTGISIGVIAAIIDVVSQWLSSIRIGYCKNGFYQSLEFCCIGVDDGNCNDWVNWKDVVGSRFGGYMLTYMIYVVFSILFSIGASVLVVEYAPYAKLSGIAEIKTILGGFVIRGFLGTKTLITKTIGLCLVVGAGLWVGKEGPLVHLACCCANIFLKLFEPLKTNDARKRQVFSAASAAGISVAFGAPIGGVLFTLEQVSYYTSEVIMWQSFVCAMIAAVSLQTMNPFRTGKLVLFQVVYDRVWHNFELVPLAFIGVLGGLYGTLMIKLNMKIAKWRKTNSWTSNHPVIEVALTALTCSVISYPNIFMRLQSSVLLSFLFQECSSTIPGHLCEVDYWFTTVLLLIFAVGVGTLFTAYSFGLKIPAGIIMPSMVTGALGGRVVGLIMQALHDRHPGLFIFHSCPPEGICITPGVYSLVGAASALTGVTRLTASSVVIMFELTGALSYVLPIMTGVIVSKWVADSFGKMGIYESWIQMLEYPLLNKLEDTVIPEVQVSEFMTPLQDVNLIYADSCTIDTLETLLSTSKFKGFPIIISEDNLTLIGYITRRELIHALNEFRGTHDRSTKCTFTSDGNDGLDLRPWIELNPITIPSQGTLHLVANMFQNLGLRYLILTEKGQLKGIMTKKDMWWLLSSIEGRESINDAAFSIPRRLSLQEDAAEDGEQLLHDSA